jgi:hypothetical protein
MIQFRHGDIRSEITHEDIRIIREYLVNIEHGIIGTTREELLDTVRECRALHIDKVDEATRKKLGVKLAGEI